MVCKEWNGWCSQFSKGLILEKKVQLIDKYKKPYKESDYRYKSKVPLPSVLFNALSTVYDNSWREFTPELERDIKAIVKLIPVAIHYNESRDRNEKYVTPLMLACLGEDFPPHIVEHLLDNGASPYKRCKKKGGGSFLDGFHYIAPNFKIDNRSKEICAIFEKKFGPNAPTYIVTCPLEEGQCLDCREVKLFLEKTNDKFEMRYVYKGVLKSKILNPCHRTL